MIATEVHFDALAFEWAVLLLAAPVLAFPSVYPILTIGILSASCAALVFLGIRNQSGPALATLAGPLWIPWIVLAAAILAGAIVSPFPALTLPKLASAVLGMMLLRVVLLTAATATRLRLLVWMYLIAGTGVVLAAMFISPVVTGDDPYYVKFDLLWSISSRLPRILDGLPGAERGINPNALGGTTLFFLPLSTALTVYTFSGRPAQNAWGRRFACVGLLAVLAVALLFSQSRTAWVSFAVAGCVMAATRFKVRHLVFGTMATAALIWGLWAGATGSARLFGSERLTAWSVGMSAIQSAPLTGIGLGAIRGLEQSLQVHIKEPLLPLVHAHNTFLQVALDTGLIGLLAYVGMLVVATRMTFEVMRRTDEPITRALAVGLWGSLVAIHVFGMADAIALGAKVGIFLWWNLALIVSLHNVNRDRWMGLTPPAVSAVQA